MRPPVSALRHVLNAMLDRTTQIGKMIDSYLRSQSEMDDRAIHLLFSANRWELAYVPYLCRYIDISLSLTAHQFSRYSQSITESLEAGTTVICDRYAFSGIAFSAAKNAPGMSYEWCRAPDISLPAPDLTLFLAVTPEQQRVRGNFGAERYEKAEFQERVEHVFERIGVEMGDGSRWIAVDADGTKEEVAEEMWRLVQPIARGVDRPLAKLWADMDERVRNSHLYI